MGEAIRARRTDVNRGFAAVLMASFVLHAALFVLVMYSGKLTTRGPVINSIPVQLVRLGKKRDPNLLPRKVAPPPPAAAKKDAVALDNKDAPNTQDTKSKDTPKPDTKLSAAAERLLQTGAQTDIDRALERLDEIEGDPQGDPLGTTTDATNAASGYALEVSRVLKANYSVPDLISASERRFLEAEVVLYIERDGTILKHEFVKPHNNELFMAALEALLRRIRLPPPPKDLARAMAETGLGVVFKP